jgi:hypothetical protein
MGQCNPDASSIGPQGAAASLTASITPPTIAGREQHWWWPGSTGGGRASDRRS